MTSENPPPRASQGAGTTSENTAAALADYQRVLRAAPLSAETRRTYLSRVRGYLTWLAAADTDGDPLTERRALDWAVRDYRTHLQAVLKRTPATVNNALAAVDDLYMGCS